jgi:hypothetical protein
MFYTNTRSPVKQNPCQAENHSLYRSGMSEPDGDSDFFHRPDANGSSQDFQRAQQDRLGGGGLVSIAYWIVRGVQLLFGLILRFVRRRPTSGR